VSAPAEVGFTLTEAASFLDPPITTRQLRAIVRALGLLPTGYRYTGRRGHPELTYNAQELLRLHAALGPWLARVLRTVRHHPEMCGDIGPDTSCPHRETMTGPLPRRPRTRHTD